jgi:hypothetical protein
MPLRIYHVRGARHYAVVFATSPEEAVAQAVERNLVGDGEVPDAVEVPLQPAPCALRLATGWSAAADVITDSSAPGRRGLAGSASLRSASSQSLP